MNNHSLSIIVPLGPDEPQWPPLLNQLALLPAASEVILVGDDQQQPPPQLAQLAEPLRHLKWQWRTTPRGRANQLNGGAAAAGGDYLWFLHADTLLTEDNVTTLQHRLGRYPLRLYYFDLYFSDKSTRWLRLNEWGARLRSNWLGAPFGDQGLCLSRQQFEQLGGYDPDAAYGEDHLLVWHARQQGIRLCRCATPLATSARKYQQRGWGALTLTYQRLWIKQAWPQWLTLLRNKFISPFKKRHLR